MDRISVLTNDENHRLQWLESRPAEGVDYLINILPKKSFGWWDYKLIDSLEKSSSGTAHHELAGYLEKELLNTYVCIPVRKNGHWTNIDIYCIRTSA